MKRWGLVLSLAVSSVGAGGPWPVVGPAPPGTSAALIAARELRSRGCDGHSGIRESLRTNAALNAAALRWSHGADLRAAVEQSGYREEHSAALHVSGEALALQQAMRSKLCAELTDRSVVDLGSIQRGHDTWIIIAAPFTPPARSDGNQTADELLQRINRARSQPRRCGNKSFPAAPPLQSSALLRLAAEAHAQDMVSHDYFAHEGSDASTPAQRVGASGYRYKLVGENIASGPQTAAEAAEGWLASPGHCENIMDPRFTESGIGYAANGSGAPRVYWVQVFATPR